MLTLYQWLALHQILGKLCQLLLFALPASNFFDKRKLLARLEVGDALGVISQKLFMLCQGEALLPGAR